jgi:hypothetical protein
VADDHFYRAWCNRSTAVFAADRRGAKPAAAATLLDAAPS